jgi:phenylacetaldehyde dehydrogenase
VFEYYAGWATKLSGSTLDIAAPGEYHTYTLREPVGVAGLIVAWNVPLQIAASKLAPALAAGCTAVLKPAEQTPLSALRLGGLIQEIGFPPGVINIVNGVGASAGAALAEHPGVDKISFTGSTETGRRILNAATGNFKRVTLELGGKSPVIIFPDADLPLSIPAAASGVFHNSGQVCAAGTRLFAHKKVFDQVVEGIAAQARQLKVGPGLDETSDLGPVVSKTQLERVVGYMDAGAKDGAKIVTGGKSIERDGYYVQPTLFTDTTLDMSIRREEIFGPVLCAMSFDDEDLDAIAAEANESIHGLSARIFTRDISTAHKMARRLKAGSVRINGGVPDMNVPFGGYKQSGWGREGGREGVESYTEIKTVIVRL